MQNSSLFFLIYSVNVFGWLETQGTGHHMSHVNTVHYRSITYFQQKLTWEPSGANLEWRAPTHDVTHPLIRWSREVMKQIKNVISSLLQMTTKIDRVVTYNEGKPSIKLHDPLITWVYVKIKNIVSPFLQGIWPPNLAGWWLTERWTTHEVK